MKKNIFNLKLVFYGAVIYLAAIAAYVVSMWISFTGSCAVLGWPGLNEGGVRPRSFYEYMTVSLATPFWPYTFWHAVAAGPAILLLLGGLLIVLGHIRSRSG